MGRMMPLECRHGTTVSWGDFGPHQDGCPPECNGEAGCPDNPGCPECDAEATGRRLAADRLRAERDEAVRQVELALDAMRSGEDTWAAEQEIAAFLASIKENQ